MMALSSVAFNLIVITSSIVGNKHRGGRPRVLYGVDDVNNEYPYVVCLQDYYDNKHHRACSGSLITKEWVITASHCLEDEDIHLVRYGNMSIPWNETKSYSRILKQIMHPSYNWRFFEGIPEVIKNDIGLVLVEEIRLDYYGKLSAIDYKTLMGLRVKYAGFGFAFDDNKPYSSEEDRLDQLKQLQIGDAAIVECDLDKTEILGPFLCIAPPCAKKRHIPMRGDSGGPLLFHNKIVGVLFGGMDDDITQAYTPVSPYIDWILDVMSKKDNN